jgi:Protein of unknown function (DUF559)
MIESKTLWKIAGSGRSIPQVLLERARELRKQQTPTEDILWECLQDRRFLNAKFRRQHNIGRFIADFYGDKSSALPWQRKSHTFPETTLNLLPPSP